MDNRRSKINCSAWEVEVILGDHAAEFDLVGADLLRLDPGQPGARVLCTTGTLWLTQQGDLNDHLLKAGQSFVLDQPGTVLAQGLPSGKALISLPYKEKR